MNFTQVATSGVESDVAPVAPVALNKMQLATIEYGVTLLRGYMMGFAFHCASVGSPACVFHANSINELPVFV